MIKFKWETEFKQTEIGEVPREWGVKNLKEATEINKTPQGHFGEKANFIRMEDIPTDGVYPSFVAVDVKEIRSGIEVLPNSILLAKITPSFEHGKMCIVPNINEVRWFATTEVFSLVPKGQNSLFFFFYLLKHPILREPLEWSMSGTSGRQRVQLSALKTLPILLPPPLEQSRIATVLSWFDDLIENKKRQNEILEKTAMAIFKSWFVDFEPFKDEEFVYSEELGKEIPKGWEVEELKEIANIIRGVSFNQRESSFEHFPNSVPILRANNIKKHMIIDFSNIMFIPTSKISKEKYLQERDLVMIASNGNPKLVGNRNSAS